MIGRILMCVIVVVCVVAVPVGDSFAAQQKSSSNLLKEGLLGAGAGAVGGAASGAKGGDVWKGALAGAGVNIIGGALLDSISGPKADESEKVETAGATPRTAYSDGYEAGYANGYKKGYSDGYKDGLKEGLKSAD
ncbi:MAG: hypothetical protein ABH844_07745 [Candidatus Omnitrophota bacterium]